MSKRAPIINLCSSNGARGEGDRGKRKYMLKRDLRSMRKQQVAMLVIAGGVLIFLLKVVAYLVSNSVALLSDALESIINIVASVMLLISLKIAAIPEDKNHEYGHQKAENISAFIEGFLILIAAVLIVEASIGRILNPVVLVDLNLGMVISLCATSMNGGLSYLLLKESKKNGGSIAMEGDSRHLLSDVFSSGGVVLGLFIASITGLYILDPLLALLMAAIIIRMGFGIIKKASRDLMDESCPEVEEKIESVMADMEGCLEYHALRTRKIGSRYFAEFHLCVDGNMSVRESHQMTDRIEEELKKDIPDLVLSIHVETEDECCNPLFKKQTA